MTADELIAVRALAVLVAIFYAATVGWMAAIGETPFAYFGGLLTICTYGAVVFLTIRKEKIVEGRG